MYIQISGRIREVYKDQELGWCIKVETTRTILAKYTYLRNRPQGEKFEIGKWVKAGTLIQ